MTQVALLTSRELRYIPMQWPNAFWILRAPAVLVRSAWVMLLIPFLVLLLAAPWSGVVDPSAPPSEQGSFFSSIGRFLDYFVLAFFARAVIAFLVCLFDCYIAGRSWIAWSKGTFADEQVIKNNFVNAGACEGAGMLLGCYPAIALVTNFSTDSLWPFAMLTWSAAMMAFGFWGRRHIKCVGAEQAPNGQIRTENTPRGETQPRAEKVIAETSEDRDYRVPVTARAATLTFADIIGMDGLKKRLLQIADEIVPQRAGTRCKASVGVTHTIGSLRNGILFHGEPGNGKTMFAEAIAGQKKLPFIRMSCGEFSSQWQGNRPKVIARTFAYAKSQAPCVLFLDEIDSFIKSRDHDNSFRREDDDVTNALLTEIGDLRGSGVILIGATNFLKKLDVAAIREGRFDFKVEIEAPDEPARVGLLQQRVAARLSHISIDATDLDRVARRWNGFSIARLMAVVDAVADLHADNEIQHVDHFVWIQALRRVQGTHAGVPSNAKTLNEMMFEGDLHRAVTSVTNRLKNLPKIERLGGTGPSGVLFYGPPGTGKTATAMAIAKAAGWSFVSASSAELMQDPSALERIHRRALDLRPSIVFIDEADDILANRQHRYSIGTTADLLTHMDGADWKSPDVVWIAVTNHPDRIDPALLRSGRFTEKVHFTVPSKTSIEKCVVGWLQRKNARFGEQDDILVVTAILEGEPLSNVDGFLQAALNDAISTVGDSSRDELPLIISSRHIQFAAKLVLGSKIAALDDDADLTTSLNGA